MQTEEADVLVFAITPTAGRPFSSPLLLFPLSFFYFIFYHNVIDVSNGKSNKALVHFSQSRPAGISPGGLLKRRAEFINFSLKQNYFLRQAQLFVSTGLGNIWVNPHTYVHQPNNERPWQAPAGPCGQGPPKAALAAAVPWHGDPQRPALTYQRPSTDTQIKLFCASKTNPGRFSGGKNDHMLETALETDSLSSSPSNMQVYKGCITWIVIQNIL